MFKFDAAQFAEGTLTLQVTPWAVAAMVVLLAVIWGSFAFAKAPQRVRAISAGLRLIASLLLIIPLLEPRLVMPEVVPDENFVAILVDVSDSMQLQDLPDNQSRLDLSRALLFDPEQGLWPGLEEIFKVRLYTFAGSAARADSIDASDEGHSTDLSAALDRVLTEFRGLPLTGIVLITDGNTANRSEVATQAAQIRSSGIGLHVIGVGASSFEAERELVEAVATKGVGERTGAEIELKVRSSAREPEPVAFTLFDGDVAVLSETRRLKGEGRTDQMTFFFEAPANESRQYQMSIARASDELNARNNSLPVLVNMRRDTLRVLYFEGHLRQDFKFIKRALENDQVIEFTSITRTGTGKYYRQGIRSPDELAGGFPVDEEALYAFDALILGDVEASAFSMTQLQLMESFVRVRGGGFLMMGGRNSFAEGHYAGTPVADMLPVRLDFDRVQVLPVRFATADEERGFEFVPTDAGITLPFMRLSPDPAANRSLWGRMPKLTSINYLGGLKPGAQLIARKPEDQFGPEEPLFAIQRYGKGRTAALATSSTWRWQMLLEADDERHERFWQQFARWLAASAPRHVNIEEAGAHLEARVPQDLNVRVYDPAFRPQGGAVVEAVMVGPDGTAESLAFRETLTREGMYTARYTPESEGMYELRVQARSADGALRQSERSFLARQQNLEYYDATLKRDWLESLATTYYEPSDAAEVPIHLRTRRTSTSVYRAAYLWDMPLLLILCVLILCGEWFFRRRSGLR
ncbi:MAG: glutamine amidotransferase [Bacteroidota bacterium]|nr:glutamine amidotransferase [Bacteroidota bacterium]MDE2957699.1 glutamine amidotransferase [Bacteroidota bacterium]